MKVILEEVRTVEDFISKSSSALGYLYFYDDTTDSHVDHKAWLKAMDWSYGKITIVGSKIDIGGNANEDPPVDIKDWLDETSKNTKHFRVSSKSGENIEESMNDVLKLCSEKVLYLHSEYY